MAAAHGAQLPRRCAGTRRLGKGSRAAILADRASRSRAASEPGEVARLADEAISKMIDFAEDVWQAGRDGFRCDSIAPCRERRAAAEAAIRRLASMASGPASEAQAGWVMVPREPTPEMLAAGVAAAVGMKNSAPWCPPCYRAMLASAPQPASSPVAAEGQKVREMYLGLCLDDDDTLHATIMRKEADGGATVLLSDYVKMPRGQDIIMRASDPATPTASMADAAEVVQRDESDPLQQLTDLSQELGLYEFPKKPLAATPGPRGENAGEVVEALSREQLEPLWRKHCHHAIGVIAVQDFNFACAVMNACATAWGLRIAEKGDAS
jgi:hypothetical protein